MKTIYKTLALVALSFSVASAEENEVRKLLVVKKAGKVDATVGDVIQFEMPAVPVTATQPRLDMKSTGDKSLQLLNRVNLPNKQDGKTVPTVFFLVTEIGKSKLQVILTKGELTVEREYEINVTESK